MGKCTNGQKCKWAEERVTGDLLMFCCGEKKESARIPYLVIDYSAHEKGEHIRVNVEGLKNHIEEQLDCSI